MTKNELLNAVVELAREIDKTDSIDFGMLRITEETAYRFVATNLIEDVTAEEDPACQYLLLMATATHLLVENFVLNQKLLVMVREKKESP